VIPKESPTTISLRDRFLVRPHAKGHEAGIRRATIKAHPATPHHPRPYGTFPRMDGEPVEGSLDREEGVLYNDLRLSGTSE